MERAEEIPCLRAYRMGSRDWVVLIGAVMLPVVLIML